MLCWRTSAPGNSALSKKTQTKIFGDAEISRKFVLIRLTDVKRHGDSKVLCKGRVLLFVVLSISLSVSVFESSFVSESETEALSRKG